jgi:hypothetical protein
MKRTLKPYLRLFLTALAFSALALTGCGGGDNGSSGGGNPPLTFVNNQAAGVVIGQADFSGGNANRGGTVAANTLDSPFGNPVVYNGMLYLPDYNNARVLGFNSIPAANGASADFVIGQTDLVSAVIPATPTASNMSGPQTLLVDSDKLFLVDYDLNRLTIYNSVPTAATANPGTANLVVGQPDFTTAAGLDPPTNASLIIPESAAVAGGKLIVTDSGNNRVLIWDPVPTANNAPATLVLGQPDVSSNAPNNDPTTPGTPSARSLSNPTGVWSDGTRLVVADSDNNRVLIWNSFPSTNQAAADVVLGQQDFTGSNANNDPAAASGTPTARTLSFPYAVFSKNGRIFLADQDNSRVLVWNSFPTLNQTPADVVLGQVDFSHNAANDDGTGVSSLPTATRLAFPSGLYVNGGKLFVADGGNNRYLIYNGQ